MLNLLSGVLRSLGASLRYSVATQMFPPAPAFTEKNLPDLAGRVYIVTGANTGVGRELTRLLYGANATVYLACRSEAKARQAMDELREAQNSVAGRLELLLLDLADLRTIKPAVESFLAREKRLDVLFNNAGVLMPPADAPTTAQGYSLELGVNCLGPFLLTRLLTPVLAATAKATSDSVRVVWIASIAAELFSSPGGFDLARLRPDGKGYLHEPVPLFKYGDSKAGNYLHSTEFARRHRADGIISVAANPGNLNSDLYRTVTQTNLFKLAFHSIANYAMYEPIYGAYTELFCGLSPDVTLEKTGSWIGPWGRFFDMQAGVAQNAKPKSEGGGGGGEAFWEWSEQQVKPFL